jgi:dipeptidyl aminopeptidase/acylaminoacyl peptidase
MRYLSNVPILGSEQMHQALKALGRTMELVVYPGEYHGFKDAFAPEGSACDIWLGTRTT